MSIEAQPLVGGRLWNAGIMETGGYIYLEVNLIEDLYFSPVKNEPKHGCNSKYIFVLNEEPHAAHQYVFIQVWVHHLFKIKERLRFNVHQ